MLIVFRFFWMISWKFIDVFFLCLDYFNENPNKNVDGDNGLIIFVITIMIFVRKKKDFRSVAGSVSIMYLIHFYVIYRFTGTPVETQCELC